MASIETRTGKRGTSYRVVWWSGQKPNRYKKSANFPTRKAAEDYAKLIEHAGGDQAAADQAILSQASSTPALSEVAEAHISRLIDTTPYTATKYRQAVRTHLQMLDIPVDQVTEDDIVRWVAWMNNEARGGKGYAAKTIKNTHGLLYSIMAYAVKRGHRPDNPADGTRLPKVRRGDVRDKFLTHEEFVALLPHFLPKYQPYARFMFATGLRAGELLALTPEDFSVMNETVNVRVSKAVKLAEDGVGTYIGEPKTDRSYRTIDVDEGTMAAVWPLVRTAGHGRPVFPSGVAQATHRLSQNMMVPAVARAERAGFTKSPGLHAMRHSHAAHMLGLGMPIHELSWRLGHSSVQVTIDRYGHLVPARMGTASRLFAEGTPALEQAAPAAEIAST